ncbi:MAG: D-aminoacylase [Gemmatimonadota bacterium]|nr:MAG: D-aminoacylase [Gemmatimonadota bacterium]
MARNIGRRDFVNGGVTAALGAAFYPFSRIRTTPSFDLVITNGTILDGTGGPSWHGDLGLLGDTITAIGSIDPQQAGRVLDASGLHVAPGFIDIHSHSDQTIFAYPTADSRVRQGITTEVTGNCGSSAAPLEGVGAERRRADLAEDAGVPVTWNGVASYFDTLDQLGLSINQAFLIGQGTIRRNVAGLEDRLLTADELGAVVRALEQGMDEGAFGLSTGLEYAPGMFTPTDEIVALASVVARRGGLYASHIRDEEAALLEAVDEAIQIGRRSGVRVEIAHFKAAGRANWGKQRAALNLVEAARRDGVQVLADAYPYTAYSTSLTIFLPAWARAGGWLRLKQRLDDAAERARIRADLIAQVAMSPGGFDRVVITSTRSEENRVVVGQSLDEIAASWQLDPADAALKLILEEEGNVGMVGHGMSAGNVEMVLSHPLVMIGSDGRSVAPTGKAAETKPHPRYYGTCARVLAHYCRERQLFDLPAAVRKMTSMPADQAGIRDRGRIARGKKADLVVFSAEQVKDQATFADPHRFASGIEYVLVNGKLVVDGGSHTGGRPGQVLRKG